MKVKEPKNFPNHAESKRLQYQISYSYGSFGVHRIPKNPAQTGNAQLSHKKFMKRYFPPILF